MSWLLDHDDVPECWQLPPASPGLGPLHLPAIVALDGLGLVLVFVWRLILLAACSGNSWRVTSLTSRSLVSLSLEQGTRLCIHVASSFRSLVCESRISRQFVNFNALSLPLSLKTLRVRVHSSIFFPPQVRACLFLDCCLWQTVKCRHATDNRNLFASFPLPTLTKRERRESSSHEADELLLRCDVGGGGATQWTPSMVPASWRVLVIELVLVVVVAVSEEGGESLCDLLWTRMRRSGFESPNWRPRSIRRMSELELNHQSPDKSANCRPAAARAILFTIRRRELAVMSS